MFRADPCYLQQEREALEIGGRVQIREGWQESIRRSQVGSGLAVGYGYRDIGPEREIEYDKN